MRVEMMEYARESGVILSIELLFIHYSSHAITRRPLANTSVKLVKIPDTVRYGTVLNTVRY